MDNSNEPKQPRIADALARFYAKRLSDDQLWAVESDLEEDEELVEIKHDDEESHTRQLSLDKMARALEPRIAEHEWELAVTSGLSADSEAVARNPTMTTEVRRARRAIFGDLQTEVRLYPTLAERSPLDDPPFATSQEAWLWVWAEVYGPIVKETFIQKKTRQSIESMSAHATKHKRLIRDGALQVALMRADIARFETFKPIDSSRVPLHRSEDYDLMGQYDRICLPVPDDGMDFLLSKLRETIDVKDFGLDAKLKEWEQVPSAKLFVEIYERALSDVREKAVEAQFSPLRQKVVSIDKLRNQRSQPLPSRPGIQALPDECSLSAKTPRLRLLSAWAYKVSQDSRCWSLGQSTMFILAGVVPKLPRLRIWTSNLPGGGKQCYLELFSAFNYQEMRFIHKTIRELNGNYRQKGATASDFEIIAFVEEVTPGWTWTRRFEEWKRTHESDIRFSIWRSLRSAYVAAKKRSTRP